MTPPERLSAEDGTLTPFGEALQIAAQCWCDPETAMIEMDDRLAAAFARRITALRAELAEAKILHQLLFASKLEIENTKRDAELAEAKRERDHFKRGLELVSTITQAAERTVKAAAEAQVTTLTADNAALVSAMRGKAATNGQGDLVCHYCNSPGAFEIESIKHRPTCILSTPHPGKALLDERDRLREALKKIVGGDFSGADDRAVIGDWRSLYAAQQDIARAALATVTT